MEAAHVGRIDDARAHGGGGLAASAARAVFRIGGAGVRRAVHRPVAVADRCRCGGVRRDRRSGRVAVSAKCGSRACGAGEFLSGARVDVLEAANAEGNLAVPFRWGSYALWRLYPRIQVSIDGRYEETYPDATFEMNHAFFYREGRDWDRLLRNHRVDFIVVELRATRVTLDDLRARSFDLVWSDGASALLARSELAPALRAAAARLPETTIEPLDAHIPDKWWR